MPARPQEDTTRRHLLKPEDSHDTNLLRRLNLVPPPGDDEDDGRDLSPNFLLSFLSRARRPTHSNLRIAPGITYFQLSSMRDSLLALTGNVGKQPLLDEGI